jgi:hypothetical protein
VRDSWICRWVSGEWGREGEEGCGSVEESWERFLEGGFEEEVLDEVCLDAIEERWDGGSESGCD